MRNLQKMDAYKKITKEHFELLRDKYKPLTRKMMDESLVKCIEFEYACQFLQCLNMEANQVNINVILEKHPLSHCEIQTQGWDNIAEMVDNLSIYPYREGRHAKNFYNHLREKLFGWKSSGLIDNDSNSGKENAEELNWRMVFEKVRDSNEKNKDR